MNIERMQKINELAKQMVQHGVVSDMDEATKQAEVMVNRGDTGIADVMELKKEEGRQEEGSGQRDSNVEDELNKLAFQVQEQSKTIKSLKQEMDRLRGEMQSLKSSGAKSAGSSAEKSGQEQSNEAIKREPEEPQTHLKKEEVEKPKAHPRAGGYDSDDVSIEKYFYSGPPKEEEEK
ncbi:MAG: hypothetical protein R6U32_00120 [Candidatus Woesearchaeota archaeon]